MKKAWSRGKHSELGKSKKLNKKKVVFFIILFIVCTVFIKKIINNKQYKKENNVSYNIEENSNDDKPERVKEITKVDMPDKIENYNVIGQLIIEKINFNNYILDKTTDDSLNFSVTKFYGPKVNKEGNFCITGHNTKEELFKNLKKMEINDDFYIIDKENYEKITYKIYNKYTITPTDLNCLNQDTEGKKEVTLITCNPRRFN